MEVHNCNQQNECVPIIGLSAEWDVLFLFKGESSEFYIKTSVLSHNYPTQFSHNYPTQLPHTIIPHNFLTQFSHTIIPHNYPTQFSHTISPHNYPTQFSHTIIQHNFPKQLSHTITPLNYPFPHKLSTFRTRSLTSIIL
jgi:hypothetical protein